MADSLQVTNNRGTFTVSNYSGHAGVGDNYHPNDTIKGIAKIFRQQVRKSFGPKGFKISVRKDHYNHISVTIKTVPDGFFINETGTDHWGRENSQIYTKEANALLDLLRKKLQSFNRDDSNGMIDYFDTKFYCNVTFDSELNRDGQYTR